MIARGANRDSRTQASRRPPRRDCIAVRVDRCVCFADIPVSILSLAVGGGRLAGHRRRRKSGVACRRDASPPSTQVEYSCAATSGAHQVPGMSDTGGNWPILAHSAAGGSATQLCYAGWDLGRGRACSYSRVDVYASTLKQVSISKNGQTRTGRRRVRIGYGERMTGWSFLKRFDARNGSGGRSRSPARHQHRVL